MTVPAQVKETIAWTALGLVLEVCCPIEDSFAVTVRRTDSAGVLWDGDVIALGRTLDDLPNEAFTVEVLARIVRDQSERLGRLVYAQDELRAALREISAAVPEPYRM
jgi:hypothetical protein